MMQNRSEAGQPAPKILVVDDSADDLDMLSAILRLEGYQVVPAHDAREALALLQRDLPDLIITDIVMPEMDGFELCRTLRAREHTSWLPIIMITAVRSEAEDRIRGLEMGADDFLIKPVRRDVLRARINSLLRVKAEREVLQRERNRLRGLNYSVARLLRINNLKELPALTLSAVMGLSGCQQAAFFLLDDEGETLRLEASQGLSSQYQQSLRTLRVRQDPRAAVILEGTRLIADIQDVPGNAVYQEMAAQEDFCAVAEVPLRGAERVWGMVALYYAKPHAFDEAEVDILVALSSQVALVLERLRRFTLEQRRRQVAEALQRVAQIINASLNPGEVLDLILQQLASVVPFRDAYVLLCYEDGLIMAAVQGEIESSEMDELVLSLQDYPLLQEVFVTGRLIVLAQARQDERFCSLPGERMPGSWLSVPLIAREKTIGILTVSSAHADTYDQEIADVVQSFARQASIAVENARLFEDVQGERRKLEAILQQTTDAVLAVDLDRRILLANPAVQRLLGLPPRAQGKLLAQVLQHETFSVLLDQAGQGLVVAAEILGVSGKQLYASISPIEGVGQVAVIHDITSLKELEEMRLQAERAEHQRLRRTLARYVGPDIVEQVLVEGKNVLEQRARVEAVILFADIRGFTAAVADLPPETAVEILNEFFTAMTRIVYQREGAVIDLIGDELMASFGAPLVCSNAALRAVEVAIALQMKFGGLRHRWAQLWKVSLGLGVGIDQGPAVMGNVGTAERLSFTLIGNVVNRSHRLVEQAGSSEILLSQDVLDNIPPEQRPWSALEEVPETLEGGPRRAYSLRLQPR